MLRELKGTITRRNKTTQTEMRKHKKMGFSQTLHMHHLCMDLATLREQTKEAMRVQEEESL